MKNPLSKGGFSFLLSWILLNDSPSAKIRLLALPASAKSVLRGIYMSEFKDVTIVKKANVYFNGNVTSRTIIFGDGSKKTLGVMLPGRYEFTTADREIMEILSGELDVLLPGTDSWRSVISGESFEIPEGNRFTMKVKTLTDYCCSFIK